MSRAELKILQLELWLEPARVGLITSISVSYETIKLKPVKSYPNEI